MAQPSASEVTPIAARHPWPLVSLTVYLALLLLFTLAPLDFTWRPLVDGSLGGGRMEWVPLTYACPAAWYRCLYDRVVNSARVLPPGAVAVARKRSPSC